MIIIINLLIPITFVSSKIFDGLGRSIYSLLGSLIKIGLTIAFIAIFAFITNYYGWSVPFGILLGELMIVFYYLLFIRHIFKKIEKKFNLLKNNIRDKMIEIPKINCEKTTKDIVKFIERKVKEANSKGVVVGLSGGIDSTVTAFLVTQAIGNENVFGVIMPSKTTPKEDTAHGEEIAKLLNIKYKTVEIDSIQDEIINLTDEEEVVSSIGNLKARIRMSILYYFANNRNYLVGGTGNKSEILIGYFTKFGDGASDFEPIADLYKTQVWQLSEYLKIPSEIIEKPPRAGLWNNQTDEDEIGMDYELLDKILYLYNDKNITEEKISQTLEINVQETEKIIQKIKNNEHKNKIPESPRNSN